MYGYEKRVYQRPGLRRQACSPLIQLFFGFASDIDQTNINRDIRDGNWLSSQGRGRSDYTHDGDDVGNRAYANCVNNDGIEY